MNDVVVAELEGVGDDDRPSPMATLSRWVREYLDAERAFRRAQAGVLSAEGADSYEGALSRLACAELTLRRAVMPEAVVPPGVDRDRVDLADIIGSLPGVDLAAHAGLIDEILAGRSSTSVEADDARVGFRAALRRAFSRFRRSWEPPR